MNKPNYPNSPMQKGSGQVQLYRYVYESPLGDLLLVSDGKSLLQLCIAECNEQEDSPDEVLGQACNWLDQYFAGQQPSFMPSLAPNGTAFQQLVWQLLLEIPYGCTTSYGLLAKKAAALLGKEHMSAQAIGQAVGSNPIAIIIPCHRVVGSKGQLTGYAWGLERKEKLLALERAGYTASAVSRD